MPAGKTKLKLVRGQASRDAEVRQLERDLAPDFIVACLDCGLIYTADRVVPVDPAIEEDLRKTECPEACRRAMAASYFAGDGWRAGNPCACGGTRYRTLFDNPFPVK